MLSTSHNLLHLITGTQLAKYYVFDLLTAIEQLNLSCTLQDFVLRLKKQGRDDSSDPWREELNTHRIRANRLYLHMVMHMNYRSYNIRRQDDSVNARNHHYVMMLNSPNCGHPYLLTLSCEHIPCQRVLRQGTRRGATPFSGALDTLVRLQCFGFRGRIRSPRRPHRLEFAHISDEPFAFIDQTRSFVESISSLPFIINVPTMVFQDSQLHRVIVGRMTGNNLYIGMYVTLYPVVCCVLHTRPCLSN